MTPAENFEVPALQDFVAAPAEFPPKLSPSGKQIAWYRDTRLEIEPGGTPIRGDASAWVPMFWASERVLIAYGGAGWGALDLERGEIVRLGEVRAVERPRTGVVALLGRPDPTASTALGSAGVVVHVLDHTTASGLLVDQDGIVGAFRRSGRSELARADISLPYATRVWLRIGEGLKPVLARYAQWPSIGDFRVLPHVWGNTLLVLDGQKNPFTTLVGIDRTSGEEAQVSPVPRRGAVAAVLQDPTTGKPLAYAVRSERLVWSALEADLADGVQLISASLPDDDWAPVGISDDMNTWLLQSVAPRHFGRVWLYHRLDRELACLRHCGDPERVDFRPVETVSWLAPDGQEVGGYLTKPDPQRWGLGPWPLVVLAHGSPWLERHWWGYNFTAQRLAALGSAVLAVNYRSSDGYGTRFSKTDAGDDLADAIEHQLRAGYVDPARVAMVGVSYGGILTLRTAARHPDLLRCGVSVSGAWRWPHRAGVAPPMLLLAGGQDDLVPLWKVRSSFSRLVRAGSRSTADHRLGHSLVVFPEERHSLPGAQGAGWAIIEQFLGACLGIGHSPWGTQLDGHAIEVPADGFPGLVEAVRGRDAEGTRSAGPPLYDEGPVLPNPLWAPQ